MVHAEFEQANARWEALGRLNCRMDCRIKSGNDEWDERKERKKNSEAKRRQTQFLILPCLTGTAAPQT